MIRFVHSHLILLHLSFYSFFFLNTHTVHSLTMVLFITIYTLKGQRITTFQILWYVHSTNYVLCMFDLFMSGAVQSTTSYNCYLILSFVYVHPKILFNRLRCNA